MTGRVLRIITRLTVSGPSTHVVVLNRGLDRLGWETLLAHGSIEANETEMDLAAVDVATTRISPLRRSLRPLDDARALAELARLIRAYRPDIVHTHQSKAGLLGRAAAVAMRAPVRLHTFHGTVFDGYFGPRMSAMFQLAERAAARSTTRLIVLSDGQRDDLAARRIGGSGRVAVVPLGLELEQFRGIDREATRAALGIDADAVVLVAVGRFAPIKRLDRLLRVFRRVADQRPEARLCIVGDGPLRPDLEQLAGTLGIAEAVSFVGWSSRMPEWYAAADLAVNSSDSEGTPLALIEAAAAGRPAVAGRVGGIPDVVVDGESGFVVDPDDEGAFAERILRLIDDTSLRAAMGAAAARGADRFAATRLVEDIDALYSALLAER